MLSAASRREPDSCTHPFQTLITPSQIGPGWVQKKKTLYFHYLLCSCVISASPNLPCWFFRENIRWLFFLYTPLRSGKNYLPYASGCISENGDQQMASKILFIWCWITNLRGKNKVSKHEYTVRHFMLTGFSDIVLHVHFQIVSNLSG